MRARINWLRVAARLALVCCCKAILLLAVLQLPADGELRGAEELVELYRVIDARPSPGEQEGAALHPRIATLERRASLAPLCRPQNGPFLTPAMRSPLRC